MPLATASNPLCNISYSLKFDNGTALSTPFSFSEGNRRMTVNTNSPSFVGQWYFKLTATMPRRTSYEIVSNDFEVDIIDQCELAAYSFTATSTIQYIITTGNEDTVITFLSNETNAACGAKQYLFRDSSNLTLNSSIYTI